MLPLPNTSLIPKTLNRSSNSVNSRTSVAVFTVQSPTHTLASPVQSPSHTPSITSPVKPTIHTRSSVSPVQSPSHTRSVTSPVKPSTCSHSSVSPVCKNTSSSCKPLLATDSALTTSNRHVNVREAGDKEYHKNVERMTTQYAKRKQHQCNTYCAGDSVTVRVPTNE